MIIVLHICEPANLAVVRALNLEFCNQKEPAEIMK